MRKFNRKKDQIRDMVIDPNVNKNADGSCIIKLGNTHVICTASYESDVPAWLKQKNSGWLTAEYGMLPGSTSTGPGRTSRLKCVTRTQPSSGHW